MEIELKRVIRGDGAILISVFIPEELKMERLASEERRELAITFIQAGYRLLATIPFENAKINVDAV